MREVGGGENRGWKSSFPIVFLGWACASMTRKYNNLLESI